MGCEAMTEQERVLLLAWITNEQFRLDDQFHELRNRVRFRQIDISDNVEMMLLQQRIADFDEFSRVVLRLLHMES